MKYIFSTWIGTLVDSFSIRDLHLQHNGDTGERLFEPLWALHSRLLQTMFKKNLSQKLKSITFLYKKAFYSTQGNKRTQYSVRWDHFIITTLKSGSESWNSPFTRLVITLRRDLWFLSLDPCTKLISIQRVLLDHEIPKDEACIVRDTKFDLGGKTIGIHTIAVSWGFAPLKSVKKESLIPS